MTIGLFGGTFDPIHLGHINLALELKERCLLSQVWWIPTAISPFRAHEQTFFGEKRLEMCQRALAGIDDFKVLDIEFKRVIPSYTIDTIRELTHSYPQQKFALLLGEDAALNFPLWKESFEIIKKVDILVGSRDKVGLKARIEASAYSQEMKGALLKGLIPTPMMDIEGTVIRKRLKEKLYCDHLLPAKILDFI